MIFFFFFIINFNFIAILPVYCFYFYLQNLRTFVFITPQKSLQFPFFDKERFYESLRFDEYRYIFVRVDRQILESQYLLSIFLGVKWKICKKEIHFLESKHGTADPSKAQISKYFLHNS